MKKRAALAGAAVFALLALAGCGTSGGPSTYDLAEDSITLSDGRTITCIVLDIYNGGGLSCDWPEGVEE